MERCPAPEPFLAPQSEEETPARKRGPKSAKVLSDSCQLYVYNHCTLKHLCGIFFFNAFSFICQNKVESTGIGIIVN